MSESQCPICMRIYVEPVSFPCEHSLCKPCFDQLVQQANLECPMCRRRIGSWARLSSRNGTLVNQIKWAYIKKNYAAEVEARLSGSATPKKKCSSKQHKKKKDDGGKIS